MKIINALLYFNEKRHFNFRFNYLKDVVDTFLIVEGSHTFSGASKGFTFENDFKSLGLSMNDWESKIAYCPVLFPQSLLQPEHDAWAREKFQRNYMQFAFYTLLTDDEDIVIFQDSDEYADKKVLEYYKQGKIKIEDSIQRLKQDMYYYDIHYKATRPNTTSIITKAKNLNSIALLDNVIRSPLPFTPYLNGWHFSYFKMEIPQIQQKIKSFSHQEYNSNEFLDPEKIENRVKNYLDLFDRPDEHTHDFRVVEVNEFSYLPEGIDKF